MTTTQLFVLLSVGAFLVYLYMGLRALSWNVRGTVNRAFFALCLGCGVWSLAMAMMLTAPDAGAAWLWYRIGATGWLIAPAAAAHAYGRLAMTPSLDRHRWIEPVLYAPWLVFVTRSWRSSIGSVEMVRGDAGWLERMSGVDAWFVAYTVYVLVFTLSTITLATVRWRGASTRTDRHQAGWLAGGGLLLIPVILITGFLVPMMDSGLPELSHLLVLVWVLSFWQGLRLHNPLTLGPRVVASQILESMSEAALITDRNGRLRIVNPAAAELFGRSPGAAEGEDIADLLPGAAIFEPRFKSEGRRLRSRLDEYEVELHGGDEEGRWLSISTSPILNSVGDVFGVLVRLRDITEQKLQESQLRFQATHDLLTRLPNRALAQSRLDQAIESSRRTGGRTAVAMIDLDGFKRINDEHGHAVGDRVLEETAARLQVCVRKGDTVARFGGDEFLIVLPDVRANEEVEAIADRLVAELARPYALDDVELTVPASLGLVVSDDGARHADELVQQADEAMYEVKKRGGQGYHLAS